MARSSSRSRLWINNWDAPTVTRAVAVRRPREARRYVRKQVARGSYAHVLRQFGVSGFGSLVRALWNA